MKHILAALLRPAAPLATGMTIGHAFRHLAHPHGTTTTTTTEVR